MVNEDQPAPFATEILVRFGDCDPAGIVFYPRYYEMFNSVVEDWCDAGLDLDFHTMHMERGLGVPAVRIETDFIQPSRLGDRLRAELAVHRLGRASLHVGIKLIGPDSKERVRAKLVLALMDLKSARAVALPDDLRARMQRFMTADAAAGDAQS